MDVCRCQALSFHSLQYHFSTSQYYKFLLFPLQLQTEEDERLSRILQKQKVYQQQLEQERSLVVLTDTADESTAALTDTAATLDTDAAGEYYLEII